MNGKIYNLDAWLQEITNKDGETKMSEGARWWLDRIKSKTALMS